jgi:hypothetical protein
MTEQKSRADLLREMAEIIDSNTTYATPGDGLDPWPTDGESFAQWLQRNGKLL